METNPQTLLSLAMSGIVIGVIITLYFISKRPINVNLKVDAKAEAHGGTASVSSPAEIVGGGGSVGGFMHGIFNFIKLLVFAVIAVLVLVGLTQKSEPARVVVNVPEQKAPIVNVPAAPPPVINVPQAAPPTVRIEPTAVSSGSSITEWISVGLGLISVIFAGVFVLKMLRPAPKTNGLPAAYGDWVKQGDVYVPPQQTTTADYPGLFTKEKANRER